MGFTSATDHPANPPRQGGFSRRPGIDPNAYRMDGAPGSKKEGSSPSPASVAPQPAAQPVAQQPVASPSSVVRGFSKRPAFSTTQGPGPVAPGHTSGPVLPATLNACIDRMAVENAWPPEKVRAAKVRALRDPVTAEKAYREALGISAPAPAAPQPIRQDPPPATGRDAASLREAIEQNPGKVVFAVKRVEPDGARVAFSVEEHGTCDILHGLLFESVPAQSDAFGKEVFEKPLPTQPGAAPPSGEAVASEVVSKPEDQAPAPRAARGRSP